MSELEDRLSAVLSNPAELQRFTQMASQLMENMGGGGQTPPAQGTQAPAEAPPQENSPQSTDLGAISAALGPVLQKMKPRKNPLVDAIAPYLDETRRKKLERSMNIAAAAKLAGGAFRGLGGNGHGL